jgi:hypothetical protein
MKSVLMLYPIRHFVEYDSRICLEPLETYWNSALGFENGQFRRRHRLINELIDQYRRSGFRVNWAVFCDPEHRTVSDLSRISDIFYIEKQDRIINIGLTEEEHIIKGFYPDPVQVLVELGPVSKLVIGGFHLDDCVKRFWKSAMSIGIETRVGKLLTDLFFYKVIESFQCDLDAKLIKEGKLDPTMHEDDPREQKRLLFKHRLDKFL